MSEHIESEAQVEQEPTKMEIVEAAKEFLTEEDIAELTEDPDEVYSDIVTILESQGIDWEALFQEKGIIK